MTKVRIRAFSDGIGYRLIKAHSCPEVFQSSPDSAPSPPSRARSNPRGSGTRIAQGSLPERVTQASRASRAQAVTSCTSPHRVQHVAGMWVTVQDWCSLGGVGRCTLGRVGWPGYTPRGDTRRVTPVPRVIRFTVGRGIGPEQAQAAQRWSRAGQGGPEDGPEGDKSVVKVT